MASLCLQYGARTVCRASFCRLQQARNTCVVKRLYPPMPYKENDPKELKKHAYVYELIDVTHNRPAGSIDVLLTDDVEGVGMRGDVVNVTKRIWRNQIFPSSTGMYATSENIETLRKQMENEPARPRQSVYIKRTLRDLQGMNLPIPMNPIQPWTLTKTHVKVAFRTVGVELTEECIELPEEPISEPQEIELHITVNGLQSVPVKATVVNHDFERFIPMGHEVFSDPKLSLIPGELS